MGFRKGCQLSGVGKEDDDQGPTQCLEKSDIRGDLIERSAGTQEQSRNGVLETGDPERLEGVIWGSDSR